MSYDSSVMLDSTYSLFIVGTSGVPSHTITIDPADYAAALAAPDPGSCPYQIYHWDGTLVSSSSVQIFDGYVYPFPFRADLISGSGSVSTTLFHLYLTSSEEWSGGSTPSIYVVIPPGPHVSTTATGVMVSRAKKLGKFPLGAVSDGGAIPPSTLPGTASYNGTVNPRGGSLHFSPNASFANGDPGLKGKLLRANVTDHSNTSFSYDIEKLIYDNSAMRPWLGRGIFTYFGVAVADGDWDPFTPAHPVSDPVVNPSADFRPGVNAVGHIMRMILYREDVYTEAQGPTDPWDGNPRTPVYL